MAVTDISDIPRTLDEVSKKILIEQGKEPMMFGDLLRKRSELGTVLEGLPRPLG
jgi:hypothetical protein